MSSLKVYQHGLVLFLVAALWLAPILANDDLQRQLEQIFSDPAFHRALWGVKVQSLDTGRIIFELNSEKFFIPASNMKLLTALAAFESLGGDFTYRTQLVAEGELAAGVLQGDFGILGSGDPTIGARLNSPQRESFTAGDPRQLFREWAEKLKELGIQEIQGDLVGDDSVFDDVPLGIGWAWDNLPYGYSAEISGLQFNENNVYLRILPSSVAGTAPGIEKVPETAYLQIENQLSTRDPWEEGGYRVERTGQANQLRLVGSVPSDRRLIWRSVSVEDPAQFFVSVLKETLQDSGIVVRGSARTGKIEVSRARVLHEHRSPPLRWILAVLLKVSQNLYAEALIKTLDPRPVGKSYEQGRREVERILTRAGIPSDAYVLADGSGLSRYNYLTPDLLLRILRRAYRSDYKEDFIAALPVGGEDGTISSRFRRTLAQGRVRAKTGTLSNVRALAGVVTNRAGETLGFAMIVNHYTQPMRSAEYIQDLAVEVLANSGHPNQD